MTSTTLKLSLLIFPLAIATASEPRSDDSGPAVASPPSTVEEARSRARLLHETVHGVLQVVHRDFFRPDERDMIPSNSMEEVFETLKEYQGVELRWLGVNAKIMDSDHEAQNEFEKEAVKALASGEEEFEAVEKGRYRFAGAIQLHNQCLKCHVPFRTSLEDRTAGLVINMSLKTK